jgi:TatD DNase family protein
VTVLLNGIFDSHAHYDDKRFNGDRNELISSLPGKGIVGVMNTASDLKSSRAGIALCEKYGFFICAVGIHPHEAKDAPEGFIGELRALSRHRGVAALGEMGLDYHYDFSPRNVQKAIFEAQLILADELKLPVIIHDREAHADTLAMLKRYRPKGVVHCFSGSAEMAREIVSLGMYIGFTGVVTFKNAKKVLEAADSVPDGRLLIETDCPYMAPEPFRGRRCDSSLLEYTAGALGARRNITARELADLTAKNARELFECRL